MAVESSYDYNHLRQIVDSCQKNIDVLRNKPKKTVKEVRVLQSLERLKRQAERVMEGKNGKNKTKIV